MFGNQLDSINRKKIKDMYSQGQNQMDIFSMSRRMPLLGFFSSNSSDDDFADRLNYKYTVAILIIFAFIVTNKHFGHNQISCWVPALFSKNFEEYTNLVCWVTNTYYTPLDKNLPGTEPERRHTELRYYQWVAYILLFLSLLFYLPRMIWRTLSLRSGIDIKDIIEASNDFKSVGKIEKNRRMMEYMIGTVDQYVDDPRRQQANRDVSWFRRSISLMCFMFGKFLGNYLVILYLFVKMLYILNCLGQLFLISILLGRNYYIYGATIFRDILQGKGYADSEYFPRVTMCKFQVRELALKNFSHEYNVQCVLPINLFNQQIFTFLWFWYVALLVINTCSLLIWFYRFIPINQYNYVIRRIKLLRIRLIESSKLSENASKRPTNRNRGESVEMFSSKDILNKKKTPISRILNEHDYHYSYDENDSSSYQYSRSKNGHTSSNNHNNKEELLFPNVNTSFEFNNILEQRNNQPENKKNQRNYGEFNPIRIPIITEYDTYMSPNSFCIKNYKKFVYEYLEADGMFMLRMIGSNSGDFTCTQVLHNLWKLFLFKKYTLKHEAAKKAAGLNGSGNIKENKTFKLMSSDDDNDCVNELKPKVSSRFGKEQRLIKNRASTNPKKLFRAKTEMGASINFKLTSPKEEMSYTELKRKLRAKKVANTEFS